MSSDNKYGLDFRVWGYDKTEKKKDPTPDILKSIGHGWGESSKPKKQKEVVEYTEERIEPKKEQITCILKNARFLPDENTDFGKPCKIRVEIEGESHRLVHLYLWAVYNGEEHDLRHEVEANHNKGICETEMPLFYVEPYHNDVFKNGKKDAKVEYFAKIKMHGAKEIRSELMVMPRPPATLNINEIDGPGSLSHNTKGVYVVKSFNREASQEEKDSLSWAVKINGKEIERFENVGDSFEYTPCAKYAGETITVHPFLRSPSDKLFIKTTIGQYLLYNGSELIWLDESHKEVGKWKACSSSDNADPAKENGPLPEGNWVILQDARDQNPNDNWWKELTGKNEAVIWTDKNRVELIPFKETDTHGRLEKFYLFGSEDNNSSLRGINLAGDISDFVERFKSQGNNLILKVKMGTPRIEIITKESVYRFPLDFKYQDKGYHSGVRSFGSPRNNGTRFHAGCDLYAPVGSKVYAMDDGIFIDYYHFYGQTYAMEIKHGKRVIRYGEIQPPKDKHVYKTDIPPESIRNGFKFEKGTEIIRGQLIGYVGQLRFINKVTGVHENYKLSMVHLEMYNGDCDDGDKLTQNNSIYSHVKVLNYIRRKDLLNPTEFLDNCISE